MRLNALCLIGSLAALAIPLPAGPVSAQSAEAVSAQGSHRAAVTTPQVKSAAYVCLPAIIRDQAAMPHAAILASALRVPRVSRA